MSEDKIDLTPIFDDEFCSPKCPYLKAWDHPYWHHSAWCWKQMRELSWYDYWIADCVNNNPDELLSKNSGRTTAP